MKFDSCKHQRIDRTFQAERHGFENYKKFLKDCRVEIFKEENFHFILKTDDERVVNQFNMWFALQTTQEWITRRKLYIGLITEYKSGNYKLDKFTLLMNYFHKPYYNDPESELYFRTLVLIQKYAKKIEYRDYDSNEYYPSLNFYVSRFINLRSELYDKFMKAEDYLIKIMMMNTIEDILTKYRSPKELSYDQKKENMFESISGLSEVEIIKRKLYLDPKIRNYNLFMFEDEFIYPIIPDLPMIDLNNLSNYSCNKITNQLKELNEVERSKPYINKKRGVVDYESNIMNSLRGGDPDKFGF